MKKSIWKLFREFLEDRKMEEAVRVARERFLENPTEAILKELILQADPGVALSVTLVNGSTITVTKTRSGTEVRSGKYVIEGDF